MKKIVLFALTLVSFTTMAQQSFAGFRNGYYSGTHRVLSNPASIAGSPRKWDVNLFSLSANVSNDFLDISLKNFTNINKIINESVNSNSFTNFSGKVNVDVLTPSFMIAVGKKHSLAVTSRARIFGNVDNFNVKFFQTLLGDINEMKWSSASTSINEKRQSFQINAFGELGATWASTIIDTDNHQIKVGATVKYVQGAANAYVAVQDLNGNLSYDEANKQATLTASGSMSVVSSGVDYNSFKMSDITNSKTTGIGFDIGVVYEYHPVEDAPYKFKAGIAITDIGTLTYSPLPDLGYTYSLSSTTITYKDDFQKKLNEALTKTIIDSYKTSLPTALQANLDYHMCYGVFFELAGQFGLSKDDNKPQNAYYGTNITFTPRWENKSVGFYLPFNYNDLSKLNVGTAIRLGPLLVGSSSVLTSLSDKSKQADVFLGVRFGF